MSQIYRGPTPSFYQSLSVFTDFSKVLNESYYVDAPKDWMVVLTDIKGSTKAIENGFYKQVNMLGAASITCVLNCFKNFDLPFVFGGDGATILIPPEAIRVVSAQLRALQALAQKDFNLQLRVGFVPIRLLREQGFPLKVAKYQLSPGNHLAQFSGGAIARAEHLVKNGLEGAALLEPDDSLSSPNLEGLSCRLNPVPSKNGSILSLICKARNENDAADIMEDILKRLQIALGDNFDSASPVSADRLGWKLISPTLNEETHFYKKDKGFAWVYLVRALRAFIAALSLNFNIRLGDFVPEKYKAEFILNTDFKKYDETLRMVIDCKPEQVVVIRNLMESYFESKKIFFGIQQSSQAIVTCMVFSATQNQHIHFVDGSHGGYALAASEMKKQKGS